MANKISEEPLLKIGGRFWYSELQWEECRDQKKFRTYAKLLDGKIVEYTEMIDMETFVEDPDAVCLYPDGIYLGEGFFSHFGEVM